MAQISRQQIKDLREAIQEAIESVATEHGVHLKVGNGRYGATGSLKVEISPISDTGEVETKEAKDFKIYAARYGLHASNLGAEFSAAGERFRITGLKTRAPKRPILAERVTDGAGFVFPASTVARAVNG